MFPSEQSLESSNDYNDDTSSNHDLEDENFEHHITAATGITPVWFFNVIV